MFSSSRVQSFQLPRPLSIKDAVKMVCVAKQPAAKLGKSARTLDSDVHHLVHGFWFIQLWRKVKKTIDKKQKVYRTAHRIDNSPTNNSLRDRSKPPFIMFEMFFH